jgi:uncharacterized Zn-binding protein involved in type VI secretion
MTEQIALLTSVLTHGARIISGSPDRFVNGIAVARLGDPVYCPHHHSNHGVNCIAHVWYNQQTDSRPPAHVGASAACGAVIITGSPNVYIG